MKVKTYGSVAVITCSMEYKNSDEKQPHVVVMMRAPLFAACINLVCTQGGLDPPESSLELDPCIQPTTWDCLSRR